MTLHVQLMTMIVMTIGGVYLGFAFDTYRRLTVNLRKWTALHYVLESTFWLCQTYLLFYFLYRVNHGELRIYVFLACLLGFSIYIVLFQHIFQQLLEGIITVCVTILKWIVQALQLLFIQPLWWLILRLYFLCKGIILLIIRLLFFFVKPLISIGKRLVPERFIKNISKIHALCSTIGDKLIRRLKGTIRKWR